MTVLVPSAEFDQDTEIRTDGLWFGPPERPAAGWLTRRPGASMASAIVIAPPTGYAYWCSHRALRSLAEELAEAGHGVLRVDYDSSGDSAGDQWEPDRIAAWQATIAHAVAELRRLGAGRVSLVGTRLGATLALLGARELGADRVLAWLPIARGRRYAKEVRLLSQTVPQDADPQGRRDTRVLAGNVFTDETMRAIAELTLTDLTAPPARSVLVIDDPQGSAGDTVARLREIGTNVEHIVLDGAEDVLETPPEYAHPFEQVVSRAAAWIGRAPASRPAAAATELSSRATFAWRGGAVHEEILRLGPERHAGVLTSPERLRPRATTLVLLNPGSETHVGPGRAWVEYARDLALDGWRTVRVDFLGWGESPDAGRAPGKPYDAACVPDTLAIVRALREFGHERIAIGGLCASAWIALDAARHGDVDGVIAINPQLYWRQGDPVEIDWDLIRARRVAEIRQIERGGRVHLWSALDRLGARARAGRWLDELAAGEARIELVFAERDDGLVYLEQRFGRRLARLRESGRIGVQELSDVDHPMHLTWMRPLIVAALSDAMKRIDSPQDRPQSRRSQRRLAS